MPRSLPSVSQCSAGLQDLIFAGFWLPSVVFSSARNTPKKGVELFMEMTSTRTNLIRKIVSHKSDRLNVGTTLCLRNFFSPMV